MNNPFLTKKDPLLEAVQSAMQDGEIRRQAEALVNEEFGVYSRKAVVREQLAAYDARLEEAYKCMKEGNRDNKEKKKEHEEKTGMEHIKKMGGFPGQSPKRTARELTKEEKADKDYDKDGKVESPKDEVWGSRLRAAKMAGKLKEEEQIDEVSKKAAISAYREKEAQERDTSKLHGLIKRKFGAKTAHNAERAGAQSSVGLVRRGEDRGKEDSIARDRRHPTDRMTKSGKVHKQDTATLKGNIKRRLGSHTKPGHLPEETDYSAQDRAPVTKSAPKEDPSTPKSYPGAASSLTVGNPTSQRMQNAVKPKIQEAAYSAKAARAGKDIGKPGKKFADIAAKASEKYGSKERGAAVAGAILKKIRAKHMKEDSSFNAAQETGKSVNEVAMAMPPAITPPAVVGQRMPGIIKRGGQATGRFVQPQRASAQSPKTAGRAMVPSGSRAPAPSGASNLPATGASRSVATSGSRAATLGKTAEKASSGFTYSRLGDVETGVAKAATGATARSLATKIAGRALGVAGLAVPDATKTEPGNPVFRKTDAGKASVAGYRSSTTPRAGKSDVNTTDRMVGSMSRRGGLAPSVKNQELPSKIAPVQTKAPGTMSAPVEKPAAAPKSEPKSFSQAFSAARKEAGGGKGQFEFGGKKFQTNVNPAKGAEKYIAPSKQKETSVKVEPSAKPSAPAAMPAPSAPTTDTSTAASKVGVSQTPAAGIKTDFGAGKTLAPVPSASTPSAAQTQGQPATKAPEPSDQEKKPKGSVSTMNESVVTVGDNKYRIV